MNDNHQESYTKMKSDKSLDTSNPISKIFITKIIKIFTCVKNIFKWIKNKIDSILSSWSILTQITLTLIPCSILFILLIFFVHYNFYDNLYIFNFQKGLKEELTDKYITEMDDLHAELDSFVMKENYFDIENQLFFEVYYKELCSIGLLNNSNKATFPNMSLYSETMYLVIDNFINDTDLKDNAFTIPKSISKKNVDDRKGDSIGELLKIYYNMLPIITYGAYLMNVYINQTFFIAYEFDKNNNSNIKINELCFMLPRGTNSFNDNDNFTPTNYLLNPLINSTHFDHTELIQNSYYNENWFMKQDNIFRESVNDSQNGYSEISLAHLNHEYNGNINKSIIISSQQYINSNDRHYIINIIFFFNQNNLNKETIEYSTFIVKDNQNYEKYENEKYSDNETFVVLKSDIIEYSLANINYQYFHNGLYDKNNNFNINGILYDSFNLDKLYDSLDFYQTIENFQIDLKYFCTLYLYKTLFQTANYSRITKNREEIYLYNFNKEETIKTICNLIDFNSYQDYNKETGIDCWEKENNLYYNENTFKSVSMRDSNSRYPYCGCLPLYCLKNFENINNDFRNIKIASDINLPNKCQNKFTSYQLENKVDYNNNFIKISKELYRMVLPFLKISNTNYIKFNYEPLSQMQEYYFLIITEVKANTTLFLFHFFAIIIKLEIMTIILGITILGSLISLIIIYVNIRRYSQIIKNFKKSHELYVLDSEDNNNNEEKQKNKNNDNMHLERNNINNENMPLLQNEGKDLFEITENNLLNDLFNIFCKHYKLSRKDIEKYYSKQSHETKNQMKIKMMMEKNELFKLLAMFSILAPFFRLNLSLDYKMYNYTKIIKKYNQYVSQVVNINKDQTRLTQNILYELLSTENISDYGLISNLNFKYISNIKFRLKDNSIQNTIFENVINKMKSNNEDLNNNNDININNVFLLGDDKDNIKLILKQKNELMEMFKNKFENDDYINFNKIESSFNFYLINSYYKYLKLIVLEENYN